jgi:hypothetical protein
VAHELELLHAAGAEVHLVRLERAPVFVNRELAGGRIQECLEPGLPLPTGALPAPWRAAPAWIVAPVAGEIDDHRAALPSVDAFVTVGWQGCPSSRPAGP